MSWTVMVPTKITEQDVDDLLVTAFEGGVNYWLGKVQVPSGFPKKEDRKGKTVYEMVSQGFALLVKPDDEDKYYELNMTNLLKGMEMYLSLPHSYDKDNWDADSADAIVQFALFGEVVYS